MVSRAEFQDWGTIAVLFCVISFLSFSSFFFSILSEKTIEPEEKYENLMKKGMEDIKDLLDMQFINGLGDMQSNNHLLNELRKYL